MPHSSFFKSLFSKTLLALSIVLATTSISMAGTSVLVTQSTSLQTGPGTTYAVSGTASEGSEVVVERCVNLWCKVNADTASGWVEKSKLSFGQHARGPISGPKFNRESGGSGEICFFDGIGFTGQKLCGSVGFVIRDLARAGFDNRIISVKVSGGASALACRDFFFSSYCEHITADTPELSRWLKRAVSSIRVY